MKFIKSLFVLLVTLVLIVQTVHVVQALRFARGGQQDTFYSILACTDGMRLDMGLSLPGESSPPRGTFTRVDQRPTNSAGSTVLGAQSFTFNGPPMSIPDSETGTEISLTHTAIQTYTWTAPVSPGARVQIVGVDIRNTGRYQVGVADYFFTIAQDCSLSNPPPDREARVFYPTGGNAENPGSDVPDVTVRARDIVTSTISVNFGAGKKLTDLNVGMHLQYAEARKIETYLISPAGTRVKLFGDIDSERFGTQEIDLQNTLVRDLMPDFVLDDDSVFTFGTPGISQYFKTEAIQPAESLGQLNGEDPNGDWRLEIHNSGIAQQIDCDTATSGADLAIPDNDPTGINDTLYFPDDWVVTDVKVRLNITHGDVGDVATYLRSPKNTQIELFRNLGSTGQNFVDTDLDDQAAQSINAGTAPFTGSYRPVEPFSTFGGESWTGDWTLVVQDNDVGNQGTLDRWQLQLCGGPATTLDSWALDMEVETAKNELFLPQVVR